MKEEEVEVEKTGKSKIQKTEIPDEHYNAVWREYLKRFTALIVNSPKPSKIMDDILKLQSEVINHQRLTRSQQSALIDRCNNYINGSYGRNLVSADKIKPTK